MDPKHLTELARPLVRELDDAVSEACEEIDEDVQDTFAGTVAAQLFQKVMLRFVLTCHKAGSTHGEEMLRRMYENAFEDARGRWHSTIYKQDPRH